MPKPDSVRLRTGFYIWYRVRLIHHDTALQYPPGEPQPWRANGKAATGQLVLLPDTMDTMPDTVDTLDAWSPSIWSLLLDHAQSHVSASKPPPFLEPASQSSIIVKRYGDGVLGTLQPSNSILLFNKLWPLLRVLLVSHLQGVSRSESPRK